MVKLLREFGENVISYDNREYNAHGLGWMYRPHEFINAFIRSQLKRFEYNNGKRREFAAYLTESLAEIPGVSGPYTPDYAKPCYFSYVVEFRPDELGLDVPVRKFRLAAQKALAAEGVSLGQWQTRPVPGQTVFMDQVGSDADVRQLEGRERGDIHVVPRVEARRDQINDLDRPLLPGSGLEQLRFVSAHRTVPELAGVLGLPSREVMWWLMGCVRYNLVEAVGEPGPDGYQKYGIVSEGD